MTSDAKLYGIERADGSVSQDREDMDDDAVFLRGFAVNPEERVVEIVAVKAERLRALEAIRNASITLHNEMREFKNGEIVALFDPHLARLTEAIAALRIGR